MFGQDFVVYVIQGCSLVAHHQLPPPEICKNKQPMSAIRYRSTVLISAIIKLLKWSWVMKLF